MHYDNTLHDRPNRDQDSAIIAKKPSKQHEHSTRYDWHQRRHNCSQRHRLAQGLRPRLLIKERDQEQGKHLKMACCRSHEANMVHSTSAKQEARWEAAIWAFDIASMLESSIATFGEVHASDMSLKVPTALPPSLKEHNVRTAPKELPLPLRGSCQSNNTVRQGEDDCDLQSLQSTIKTSRLHGLQQGRLLQKANIFQQQSSK